MSSRAAQRRARKRARLAGVEPATAPAPPAAATEPPTEASSIVEPTTASSSAAAASAVPAAPAPPRYYEQPIPSADSDLYDALRLAVEQANTITGRKYRYGATLIAGDDAIPLRVGSNKKPFQRGNIHAEIAALKGCARPRGKDMIVARLAPVRKASDDSDDDACGHVCPPPSTATRVIAAGSPAAPAGKGDPPRLSAPCKVLNARPCARCEARMIQKGVRRCYFTLSDTRLGILEYNHD